MCFRAGFCQVNLIINSKPYSAFRVVCIFKKQWGIKQRELEEKKYFFFLWRGCYN